MMLIPLTGEIYSIVFRVVPTWGSFLQGLLPSDFEYSGKKTGRVSIYCSYFGDPAVSVRFCKFPPHPREWFSMSSTALNVFLL